MANPTFENNPEKIKKYVNIQKNILHEKRIKILILLDTAPKSWSQLMVELNLRNPKLLYDHTSTLLNAELIEKNEKGFYQNTKLGKNWLKINLGIINKINEND